MEKIRIFAIIWVNLLFLIFVDTQRTIYVSRFRNFTIESETGDVNLINCTIYQRNKEHVLSGSFNITKDIHIKDVSVIINRCNENTACEYFMKWKFTEKQFKQIITMKNEIWSPLFEDLTPKLRIDPPILRKGVYRSNAGTLDTKAALKFYPDIFKYVWKYDLVIIDSNDKKAGVWKFDSTFHMFVEKDRRKDRENATKNV